MRKCVKTALNPHSIRLDKKDRRIIALLNQDASMSYAAIARRVGLSRDSVRYRIEQLEKRGVLLGYAPIIDLRKLGLVWFSLSLKVQGFTADGERRVREYLRGHPCVTAVAKRLDSGGYDLVVEVWAQGPDDLEEFIRDLRGSLADLVSDYRCCVGLTRERVASVPLRFFSDL